MKRNKIEYLYLILSIIILAIAGLFYRATNASKKESVQPTVTRTSSSSSSNEKNKSNSTSNADKIKDLTKRLAKIADDPSKDKVTAIKKEIQALENGNDKKKLLQSLADVEKDLATITSIEANLGLAQNSGETGYLETAQKAINTLKAETKKAELQAKLNEIAAALASQANDNDSTEVSETKEEATETVVEEVVQEETPAQETYQEVYTPSYQEPTYTYTPETQTTYTPSVQEQTVTPTTPSEDQTPTTPSAEPEASTETSETAESSAE